MMIQFCYFIVSSMLFYWKSQFKYSEGMFYLSTWRALLNQHETDSMLWSCNWSGVVTPVTCGPCCGPASGRQTGRGVPLSRLRHALTSRRRRRRLLSLLWKGTVALCVSRTTRSCASKRFDCCLSHRLGKLKSIPYCCIIDFVKRWLNYTSR